MSNMNIKQNYKVSNLQIEGLRAVGILMVVIYHFCYRFQEIYINNYNMNNFGISYWGKFGVGLFIIISGCFITPETNNFNLIKFYIRKLIRLWPTYSLCISITFLFTHLWYLPNRTVKLKDFLLNIFFINGFIGNNYIDGAHWYLTYLISFIFIIGIISLLKQNQQIWIYVLWLILSIILKYIYFDNYILYLLKSGLYILIGGKYVGYILIGISIKRLYNSDDKRKLNLMLIIFSIIGIFITSAVVEGLGAIVLSNAVFFSLKEKLKFLKWKPLIYIASISYPLYLIHQNIGYQIMYYFMLYYCEFLYWHALIAFIFMFIFASLIDRFFEKPIQKKISLWLESGNKKNFNFNL